MTPQINRPSGKVLELYFRIQALMMNSLLMRIWNITGSLQGAENLRQRIEQLLKYVDPLGSKKKTWLRIFPEE